MALKTTIGCSGRCQNENCWPYSPELNPVERLWQHLKAKIDVFDHHVRSSLTALRDHVADIIQRYTPEQLRSLIGYGYILNAVNELG